MRQQSARNFWMEWQSHVMTKVQLASLSLQSKTIFQKSDFWSILTYRSNCRLRHGAIPDEYWRFGRFKRLRGKIDD